VSLPTLLAKQPIAACACIAVELLAVLTCRFWVTGWAAALMKAPGFSTYLGGAMLLTATVIVIITANRRVRLASQSAKALQDQETKTLAVLQREVT
jgi:membrane protein implicated in regulation of membrane protease activity